MSYNLDFVIGTSRKSNAATQFEDPGAGNAPEIKHSVALPGAFDGRFVLEYVPDNLPCNIKWRNEAKSKPPSSSNPLPPLIPGERSPEELLDMIKNSDLLDAVARQGFVQEVIDPSPTFTDPAPIDLLNESEDLVPGEAPRTLSSRTVIGRTIVDPIAKGVQYAQVTAVHAIQQQPSSFLNRFFQTGRTESVAMNDFVRIPGNPSYIDISLRDLAQYSNQDVQPMRMVGFSGRPFIAPVKRVGDPNDLNQIRPRFAVIEKYRISSFPSDFGVGKVVATISLQPGEKVKFYTRSWRRSEKSYKEASSIFDSFTTEAAFDFENSMAQEIVQQVDHTTGWQWEAEGGGGVNLGIVSFGASGGGGESAAWARKNMVKTTNDVTVHHASKASAKRETNVTTELNISEAVELETIIEREAENINLSRTLNIIFRELNQEYETYITLVDMRLAFINENHIIQEAPFAAARQLIGRYVDGYIDDGSQECQKGQQEVVEDIYKDIVSQVNCVVDYKGKQHMPLVEEKGCYDIPYVFFNFDTTGEGKNPFYPNETVPIDGVIMSLKKFTLNTGEIIMDSLLGAGIALDNYALGSQVVKLQAKELENLKTKNALQIISQAETAEEKAELFKKFFVCCEQGHHHYQHREGVNDE